MVQLQPALDVWQVLQQLINIEPSSWRWPRAFYKTATVNYKRGHVIQLWPIKLQVSVLLGLKCTAQHCMHTTCDMRDKCLSCFPYTMKMTIAAQLCLPFQQAARQLLQACFDITEQMNYNQFVLSSTQSKKGSTTNFPSALLMVACTLVSPWYSVPAMVCSSMVCKVGSPYYGLLN